MIFTGLPEVFLSNFKISLFASFLITFPFFIIQTVLFISPALYKKEKKIFFPVFFLIPILFFLGIIFAYYLLIPLIWEFFISFENFFNTGLKLELESRYSEYMKLIMFLLLASGISFEFPVLLILLVKFRILNIKILKKNRKYFFIGILIFSALLTPPDIISQLGIAIPLIIFYEFSLIFITFFLKK
jgi:sec-independent protein translocase protein TatC